jgi:hypothetical protein
MSGSATVNFHLRNMHGHHVPIVYGRELKVSKFGSLQ